MRRWRRTAKICKREEELMASAGMKHPEDSHSRDRCFARSRTAGALYNAIRALRINHETSPAQPANGREEAVSDGLVTRSCTAKYGISDETVRRDLREGVCRRSTKAPTRRKRQAWYASTLVRAGKLLFAVRAPAMCLLHPSKIPKLRQSALVLC